MNSEAAPTPAAELADVHLAFGEKQILRGVSLRIRKGERLVVLGQSGVGKSTILRLLLGILTPDSGRVLLAGRDLSRMSRRALARLRQKVGMVYQYSALISSLTVRENLALPAEELTSKSRDEINGLITEKLALVGMSEAIDRMPAELSGGMKKRVGLARALMLEPELILFDEPSAGLDPVISSVIDELIISLSEKTNATCVIVTHEMDSAFRIATRMAMLYEGEIILEAEPERFRDSDDPVVSQFIRGDTDGPIPTDTALPA